MMVELIKKIVLVVITKNLAKFKKLNLARSKKSNIAKSKKLDLHFAKANSSRTDFLIFGAKEIFLHLWNAFIKTQILIHRYSDSYIWIKTDVLGYVIEEIHSKKVRVVPITIICYTARHGQRD